MNAAASSRVTPGRLAASASQLAGRVAEPEVRAQLHALASLLDSLAAPEPDHSRRAPLEEEIAGALEHDDEPGAIAAMRGLAAIDRSAVRTVDWSAASGG